MELISGKIPTALKCVIYGPEGIGKSTFASKFPSPVVYIDTEGSTAHMDVIRTPTPTSWAAILEQARYFIANPTTLKTLVIDTADWAEKMCLAGICDDKQIQGIEDLGYGKGYVYAQEIFGKLLDLLSTLCARGVNVVLTAHAQMRKFEEPNETGAYDRWELKLSKKIAPMVKEWSDLLIFANYKINVVNVDNQGAAKGKNKALGGKRVMYMTHHPCWDAKNRFGLPDEAPFDFSVIARLFTAIETIPTPDTIIAPAPEKTEPVSNLIDKLHEQQSAQKNDEQVGNDEILDVDGGAIPPELRQLMAMNNVTAQELRGVVAQKGYFPEKMPIRNYPTGFLKGVLISAWDKVFAMVQESRKVPF